MSFLKQFFGSSKPATPETTVIEVCQFTVEDGECSLVQQLKQKQTEKRKMDAKIKDFETSQPANVLRFMSFLMDMERHGFEMGCHHHHLEYGSYIYNHFKHRYGVGKLEDVLGGMSDTELNMMFEELKALKHRAKTVGELRSQANQLSDEISELKTKLGIE